MSTDIPVRPMVGVSLMVMRDDRILLSRRKGSHGAGEYGMPGGHLELGESPTECAYRELSEECGAQFKVTAPHYLCTTNLIAYLPKHYLDVGMIAHWVSGEPETMEPDKAEGWEWHSIDALPDGRFAVVDNLVVAFHTGQTYFG